MTSISNRWVLAGSILLFSTALAVRGQNDAAASAPPDATLFTTYTSSSGSVGWIVCGSTALSSGCYASGSLGPFGRVGALMEGNPFVNLTTNTVTRAIYVVDSASGIPGNQVVLHVYKKTDVVGSTFDTVTVTPLKNVLLPLAGGSTALVSMAANHGFLFIGTDQSPQAVRVQKNNLTVTQVGGFSPPINVTAITADNYGYVTVTQGHGSGASGFAVYNANGAPQESGGGANFMLNTLTAVTNATLP